MMMGKVVFIKHQINATYPDLGPNSWLNDDKIFNMSARQAVPENTDRVLVLFRFRFRL